MSVSVNDQRTITVSLDGVQHDLTLAEAKALYEQLGTLPGVAPLMDIRPRPQRSPWERPYPQPYTRPVWVDPSVIPGTPSWPGRSLEVWCRTHSVNTKPNDAIMVN